MTYTLPQPDLYDAAEDVECYSAAQVMDAYKAGFRDAYYFEHRRDVMTDPAEIRACFERDYEGTPV